MEITTKTYLRAYGFSFRLWEQLGKRLRFARKYVSFVSEEHNKTKPGCCLSPFYYSPVSYLLSAHTLFKQCSREQEDKISGL
jgi:hypothetical protein